MVSNMFLNPQSVLEPKTFMFACALCAEEARETAKKIKEYSVHSEPTDLSDSTKPEMMRTAQRNYKW
ncbi:unnamed protein product [Toxocara canis]|uniref:NADH dehydrogenase n=1 Tax=Toxocara canis TaxID=6265 RepID=A0A183UG57_TOXCA|nr:unnamed protein product [Toxocara canis]